MERLILEREFIFDVDHERGFKKLRDNQFSRIEHGLIYEPLANAMDQQRGDQPVRIRLEQKKDAWRLTFSDNGPGLLPENLEALHYIGLSTKRNHPEEFIGRFGMGLTGAFHVSLGIKRVEIRANVCGRPSKITYDCKGDGIPLWWRKDCPGPLQGFQISFYLPEKKVWRVSSALDDLMKKTVVAVDYNGKIYRRRPESLKTTPKDPLFMEAGQYPLLNADHRVEASLEGLDPEKEDRPDKEPGDPVVHYCVHDHIDTDCFSNYDHISIYLRGLPVEEGPMYHIFVSSAGDKMPQNYYGRPYIKDESAIVLSRKAEPTVGRDKLIRNNEFKKIEQTLEKCRARALRHLLRSSLQAGQPMEKNEYARHMAWANVRSLASYLESTIQGKELPEEKTYLKSLLNDLLDYPLVSTFNQAESVSIRRVLEADFPDGVIPFTEDEETAIHFSESILGPFILREDTYVFSSLWGGHLIGVVADLLKRLLECRKDRELIMLDRVLYDEERQEELERRGVILRGLTRVKLAEPPNPQYVDFLKGLHSTINKTWFREAVSRFRQPRRVKIHYINVSDSIMGPAVMACVLGYEDHSDTLLIGIAKDNPLLEELTGDKDGHLFFLPILCHELAHRPIKVQGDASVLQHSLAFHLNRLALEDRVLTGCVNQLLGLESTGASATGLNGHELAGETVVF